VLLRHARIWLLHSEFNIHTYCDFYTQECVFNTHKSDFYTQAFPGANSFDSKLTTAVHIVVPCILSTVHLKNKSNLNICRSAIPQQSFAGNCTVMTPIWSMPVNFLLLKCVLQRWMATQEQQEHLLPIILVASSSKIHNYISSVWHTGLDNNVFSKLWKLSHRKRKYLDRGFRHWPWLVAEYYSSIQVFFINKHSK
jgi:hypothetical protein